MEKWKDHTLTGLTGGILAPVLAFYIFVIVNRPDQTMTEVFNSFRAQGVHTHIISLAVLVNLALFFIFLWTKKEKSARGVLGATILYAVFVFIIKLL